MRHIKLYEQHGAGLTLYHGSSENHDFTGSGSMTKGTFFAADRDFTDSYGDNCYEVHFKSDMNIFYATEIRDAQLLIDQFTCLYDRYYEEDEEGYEITSAEDLTNSSNVWELIEGNDGVLDWIESEGYDGVQMSEEGSITYLIFFPAQWIESYNII